MRTLVESLKRLYNATPKRVTLEKLKSMVAAGTITEEEYEYITGEPYAG